MYDVLALRRSHPIAEVIEAAGVELHQAGPRLSGRCPLHSDGDPSLVVYLRTQSYFCFGCGVGGDVIDFVSRLNKVGFKQAAAILGGMQSTANEPQSARPVERAARNPSPEETQVIEIAVNSCHEALWRSKEALAYLVSRGIDEGTARRCRVGFGHARLADDLRQHGASIAAARSLGLLRGDRSTMLGRILVPELREGKAVWVTGRKIGHDGPRYLNLRANAPILGLQGVRGTELVLTEGPFDWLTAVQWCLPAAALLGSHVSRTVLVQLRRFERIYLALDNDAAGGRAADELRAALGPKAMPVRLPSGAKDLNDLCRLPEGEMLFRQCLGEGNREREKSLWTASASFVPQAA